MTQITLDFINRYKDFLEENDLYSFFRIAAEKIIETHLMQDLSNTLEKAGIDTTTVRWEVFDSQVNDYIAENLNQPSWVGDKSNSWARVCYMMDEISDMGFGYHPAIEHVKTNSDKYSTTVRPLAPEYGWEGEGDYAFEWFNEQAFDKEYLHR